MLRARGVRPQWMTFTNESSSTPISQKALTSLRSLRVNPGCAPSCCPASSGARTPRRSRPPHWSEGDATAQKVTKRLLAVRSIKDIGPAAFRDIARYVKTRRTLDAITEEQLAFESFYSFLLPQFEGIDDDQGRKLRDALMPAVGASNRSRLIKTLNTVLGLEIPLRVGGTTDSSLGEDPESGPAGSQDQ